MSITITLKPSMITQAMAMADAVGDSLMIWGAPGIGKSQLSKAYADKHYPLRSDNLNKLKELQKRVADAEDSFSQADYDRFDASLLDQTHNFVDFRLSQIEPTDLRGIPVPVKVMKDANGKVVLPHEIVVGNKYTEETVVVWASPEVLNLPDDWKGVIIFDEINSAMPIVQAASYQLLLDRRVGEMRIPSGAFLMAAGNRENDGGVTFPLATPLRDRMTHLEMEADLEDWIEHYAIQHKVHPRVIAYLKESGNDFNTLNKQSKSHAGGTSPRSWVRASDYEYQRDANGVGDDYEVLRAILSGRLTEEVALRYIHFCRNVADLPTVNDILAGKYNKGWEKTLDVSQGYFVVLNLVYKINELHTKFRANEVSAQEWSTKAGNFLEFIHFNMGEKDAPELVIMAVRQLLTMGVRMKIQEVPYFKEFVSVYRELLARAQDTMN